MGKVKNREFWESAKYNNESFRFYFNRLLDICISRFEYLNVPENIDTRFLELVLFSHGRAILFKEDGLEQYVSLPMVDYGTLSQYGLPEIRRAYGVNGYQSRDLTDENSVIVFNNMLRLPTISIVEHYAKKLWDIDRTIDINVTAQKTPLLIVCDENERLTMKNIYKDYVGNEPAIFANKSLRDNPLTVLRTDCPFNALQINELKNDIWNEALTVLGVSNIKATKKERLLTDEVRRMQGGVLVSRNSSLIMRKKACERFNKLFGENLQVRFNEAVGEDETIE